MPYIAMGETNDTVETKQSKLPNAGLGLFAKKSFKKDDFICWYFGVTVTKDMVTREYYESDYIFEAHDVMIDAADPLSCYGRYINDGLSAKKSNCDFDEYETTPGAAYIVAKKAIRKGAELYVQYGTEYWNDRQTGLSAANKAFIANGCIE